jgi:drug/metabolite transporter (DMT)-like permease
MNSPQQHQSGGHGAGAWFNNAYLLLILTTLFWAGNATAGKLGAPFINPGMLTFVRWVIACAILYYFAREHLKRDWPVLRKHWKIIFALGGFGFTGFNLGLYTALHDTTAINVTIEQSAIPAIVIVVNFIAFSQRVRAAQIVGVMLTMGGVVATATHGDPMSIVDQGLNRGDAVMLVAVALYAGYTIGLRYKPDVHWMSLLFGLGISALSVATPFYIWEGMREGFSMPPMEGWMIIAYVAIFPSILAQLFFIRGVELLGPNRAGIFVNLVPVFGAILAVSIAGESFQDYHFAGMAMVLGGIALAERSARRK